MVRTRQKRPQVAKQNNLQRANARGIFAVRRIVSPESHETLQEISDVLQPDLHNAGRLFDVRNIAVTVIGFSRFDKRHIGIGPTTRSIVDRVHSSQHPLEVTLGSLGIYGSEHKSKLGINLISTELDAEVEDFEDMFKQV
jgi:hypothetical protein